VPVFDWVVLPRSHRERGGVRDWRILEDGDGDERMTYIQMFRDSASMRNQVSLAAFDQPSDLCDTELLGFLRVWLGSRGRPQFVVLVITICVFSDGYMRLDLIP
jgi:hypothetical protein